jgi:hypothetical protein
MGQIGRWLRMSLTYRKSPEEFKDWKERPCPQDAKPSIWQHIQETVRKQNALARDLLKQREKAFQAVAQSAVVNAQVKPWQGIEGVAQDYLFHRRFQQLLREVIDDDDLPQKDLLPPSGGIKSLFKTREDKALEEIQQALRDREEQEKKVWRSLLALEFDNIEKDLGERFWLWFEATALYWVLHEKPAFPHDMKRRLLRSGFIGRDAAGIDMKDLEKIKEIMLPKDHREFFEDAEIHVYFFDEYLERFAKQEVSPSYDEELELNGRGSPEWKVARQLRKTANMKRNRKVYLFQKKKCEIKLKTLEEEKKALELKIKKTPSKKRKEIKVLKEKHHKIKVAVGRVKDFISKINQESKKFKVPDRISFPGKFPLEFWIRKEVAHLRSKLRLLNRLKEQHLPQVLSEELKSPTALPHTPELLREKMEEVLKNDVAIFDQTIVAHRKRDNALYACAPPMVLLAPGTGTDGLCLEPAGDSGEGRLLLPMFLRGSEDLRSALVNALSDFRWDSCMLTAGGEWVTSDTLVGAYSRCRWEYRNKEKDVREKALFYKEETDKKNFRRHYRLFEKSADEGGKMLFFKSRIAYEHIIKYFVLPEGVEKVERG